MSTTRVLEIPDPQGGRNMVRAGDPVRVAAAGCDACSFKATFRYADLDETGAVESVTVVGGRGYVPGLPAEKQTGIVQWRTLRPSRVHRMAVATQARKIGSASTLTVVA